MAISLNEPKRPSTTNVVPSSLSKFVSPSIEAVLSKYTSSVVVAEIGCSPIQQEIVTRGKSFEHCSVDLVLSCTPFVNLDRISYTWQALASHNPVLRTRIFEAPDGSSYQIVERKAVNIKCTALDQQDVSHGAYLTVLPVGDGFLVTLYAHHALVDATSLAILQRDFILFYSGYAFEPHTQFLAYVNHLSSRNEDLAIEYWTKTLHDVTFSAPLHSLPLLDESPRRAVSVHLPSGLFPAISQLTAEFEVPLESLLYGIWALVSARHMHGDHESIGFAVTTRDLSFPGHETMVGLVDQDYPLVLSVPADIAIVPWIQSVRDANVKASAQAFIGYKRIIETASIAHPQVKVRFNVQDRQQDPIARNVKYSLVLDIVASDGLKLSMWHNSSVPETQVRVLLDHFSAALQYIVENPSSTLRNVDMMSSEEEKQILDGRNLVVEPVAGLIHSLVEQQAILTPNAHATQYEQEAPTSYYTLNMLANKLARQLPHCSGLYIPVCMYKSTGLVVALLAILKAGAAYVMLDPDAPLARNRYIIEDVKASFVVVDGITAGSFRDEQEIGRLVDDAKHNSDTNRSADQDPSDVAYVIYTSGSTGTPKGVLLEHRAAFNGLVSFPKIPNLRQMFFHNPVFSAAQRSIWATLAQGGCLCLASKESLTVNLARTLNTMDINSCDMTSTTASLLEVEKVPLLRRLTLGGEPVTSSLIHTWAHRVELFSSYGLSECTQLNSRQRLEIGQSPGLIGQPTDTTSSYILIPGTTNLSPLLIPGELCLGGSQLAREYLNDPTQTQKRFISNPFGPGRLYRTGDLAIRHVDGSLELTGRIDFQIKVNGQKVDPGEPNMIIQTQLDVDRAATVPALVGKKIVLVAVIVARQGSDWAELIIRLQRLLLLELPLHMIPSFWVPKDDLPLSANGKVDMSALRRIVEAMGHSGQLLPASKRCRVELEDQNFTDTERDLRRIWSQFLSLPESDIGLEDSFLGLGGSSLEAIQVVSQFQREHSTSLRVEDVILGTSLSSVASLAHEQSSTNTSRADNPFQPFSLLHDAPSLEHFGIESSEVEDAYPVTPFQEAVIADTMMGKTDYIYSRAYSFRGYEVECIRKALVTLTQTESLLRTTFVPEGMSFLQVIRKYADVVWEISDMRLDEYFRHQKTQLMFSGESYWRAAALPGDILVITTHHALFDYWSNGFLSQDITSVLMGRLRVHRPSYRLFIEFLDRQDRDMTHEFWKHYLEGAVTAKLQPNVGHENVVAAKVDTDLKACSSRLKITPSVLVYAAWAIVLAETLSSDDVVFGITLSGRDAPIPDVLQMTGPTLMIAPLRVSVDTSASLRVHLQTVQNNLWDVSRNAHYGLRNILTASGQSKDFFDTMANFLIKLPVAIPPGGLESLESISYGRSEGIKLEVNSLELTSVTLSSTLEVKSAQCLADRVAEVLQAMSTAPDQVVSQLVTTLCTDNEEYPGLESSGSSNPYLAHSSFEEIAASNPSRTAIQDVSGSVSYAELARKINQFARVLSRLGVGPESVVPVMLHKSVNTVITLYGIMTVGGAFTPLDPENPKERNLTIIEDVDARLAITDRANAPFFKDVYCDTVVIEDVDWDKLPTERNVVSDLQPENAVYVVYTSGSTGKPKGVVLTHRALSAAIDGMTEATQMDSSWRILWALNYVFDGSFYALFSVLSVGGTLCLAPQEVMVANLTDLVNSLNVTQLSVTPTMASLLHPDDVPGLKVLLVGGEPLPPSVPKIWAERLSVLSGYGPTEAAISATVKWVTVEGNLRNIGRPLKNVTVFLLEPETLEPVPFGEVGELCIAGPQVARGYLKQPQATDAVFHTRPDGSRLYQTGDLARWLPDGEIELFGRKDEQVKINGYRIELGEIENAILRTQILNKCVVVAATVLKKKQLVAFCLGKSSTQQATEAGSLLLPPTQRADSSVIKAELTTLAHYMMPTVWLPLTELPLMISGKIDRKQLVALAEGMDDALMMEYLPKEKAIRKVESKPERALQSLWSSLFDVPAEKIHANSTFHALGGDSISAINLVGMCRRKGYETTVNEILSNPTLEAQAIHLRVPQSSQALPSSRALITNGTQEMNFQPPATVYDRLSQLNISSSEIEDIYPCSPGQIEFLTQGRKQDQFWQLMTVRSLPKDFDFDRWVYLTTKLTEHNTILRTIYLDIDEGEPLTAIQVVLKQTTLNMTHSSYDSDQNRQQLIEEEWNKPFDAGRPFLRYSLLTSSQDGTRDLVIKLDHASYDGSLLRIFDDQFVALNQEKPVAPHTAFKDFITHVATSDKQAQLQYWTNLLEGHTFSYPSKVLDPKLDQGEIGKIPSTIGINELARTCGVTVPIVFQAAYTLLLSHLSNSPDDVMYDNLVTGRNVPIDNPHLINGNCANFLPFRHRLSPTLEIKDLLLQTQSRFWETTENGMVSIGDIYAALNEDRRTRSSKNLFCFQPFEPSPHGQDPMRWIVMKMSKVRMNFNYAVQLEVTKAGPGSYVFHFEYDLDALSKEEAVQAAALYARILEVFATDPKGSVAGLGLW